jgi:hypothetical protein
LSPRNKKSGAIKITLDAPPVALRLLHYEVAPLAPILRGCSRFATCLMN